MKRSLVSITFLSILIMPLGVLSNSDIIDNCSALFRCSRVPDVTYGIADGMCYIYRNPCQLGIANCERKYNNQTLIVPTTKEKCQPLCGNICPLYVKQFCAEYKGKKRTFNNPCEMNRYNCKNGVVFLMDSDGPCKCVVKK